MIPASDDVRLKYAHHDIVCMQEISIAHFGQNLYWIELNTPWFQLKSVRENILYHSESIMIVVVVVRGNTISVILYYTQTEENN